MQISIDNNIIKTHKPTTQLYQILALHFSMCVYVCFKERNLIDTIEDSMCLVSIPYHSLFPKRITSMNLHI